MFERFREAVEHAPTSRSIRQRSHFSQLVRDELSDISLDIPQQPPDKQQLNQLYELRARLLDWELGTGYLGFFSNNPGTRYTFTRRLDVVFNMLPSLKHARILEIGCGAGLLCLELAQQAEEVVGIDISHFVLDFASLVGNAAGMTNVSFQHGDAEALAFQDESFDLVICSEVLEHLLNPKQALREIWRVVKPGGTVILTTPSAESLSDLCMGFLRLFNRRIESEKNLQFDKKTYLSMQRNLEKGQEHGEIDRKLFLRVHERFSFATLVEQFQKAGFELERSEGTIFAFPPHYQLFYRYCPGVALHEVRLLERCLNRLRIFQRFGSVTTCFRLHKA